jgi:uncharacterized protein (DUF58 family)
VKHLQSLYLNNRFFISTSVVIWLFLMAYIFPAFFIVAQVALMLIGALLLYDIVLLYAPGRGVKATRLCANRFSNGDDNKVEIVVESKYPILIRLNVIDEIPHEFQRRDINFRAELKQGESKIIEYKLRPVKRGVYHFGLIRVFVITPIGFVKRRFNCDAEKSVDVYPSYLQLQKYELMAISSKLSELGIKKVRKIGHNIEFEHIKEYVEGDDYRTVNWKATARKNELMVNLYQDEKSQNVYSLIDKGRMMQMPFEGMSLLDYAINSSLVLSNIAIKKEDKAGIMTFEKEFDGHLPAAKRKSQMHLILNFLYKQSTTFGESDYSNLYIHLKNRVKRRSLLLLYTNFESIHSLDRQLPYFQKLAQSHLLVVIFFENTELEAMIDQRPKDTLGIYQKVVAEKFAFEKVQIVKTLRRYGIQAILTSPQELSVNVINKYIELKARQMI